MNVVKIRSSKDGVFTRFVLIMTQRWQPIWTSRQMNKTNEQKRVGNNQVQQKSCKFDNFHFSLANNLIMTLLKGQRIDYENKACFL